MDKPSKQYSNSPTSTDNFMPSYIPDPSLNGQSFDQLLQNRGIRFIHRRALPCPNLSSIEANNHSPECPFCDDSQLIYMPGKEIWGVFTNNHLEKMFEVQGVWEVGQAVITLPTEYQDGTQADFNTFDRLECPDFQIRLNNLIEYSESVNNIQKLSYPIIKVEWMVSIRNGAMYEFVLGTDYSITTEGNIQWLIPPWYDSINNIGEVISMAYVTNPVYVVMNLLHELRITQTYDIATGQKKAMRLPQQVLVKRDFMVNDEDKKNS